MKALAGEIKNALSARVESAQKAVEDGQKKLAAAQAALASSPGAQLVHEELEEEGHLAAKVAVLKAAQDKALAAHESCRRSNGRARAR